MTPAMRKALLVLCAPGYSRVGPSYVTYPLARALEVRGFAVLEGKPMLVRLLPAGRAVADELTDLEEDRVDAAVRQSYEQAPLQRTARTPDEELAFWRAPGEYGTRRQLLAGYCVSRVDRMRQCEIAAFQDSLRAATDLEMLQRSPVDAPLIVALRDGVLEESLGPKFHSITLKEEGCHAGNAGSNES